MNDCIGEVSVTTVEPLRLHNATGCPTGGVVRMTIAGRVSDIRFAASGAMTIDYDVGGTTNRLVTSGCRDALIAQCAL